MTVSVRERPTAATMMRKVPEVTIWFWVIKVLCTTVGETAADFLGVNLHMGLTNTTYLMSGFLAVALFFQFRARRYIPAIYWWSVVLISVVGTLITDNMVDNFGISLVFSTVLFSIALAITFLAWNASEHTLSIHSIYTTRREAFYWLAILFTFALGTAAGDLVAEKLGVGYFLSVLLFAALIGVVALGYFTSKINGVLAFWIAYILTRPLGASIGDLLSQPRADGGLGLGTTITSAIFLLTILAVVVYLSVTKDDVEELVEPHLAAQSRALIEEAQRILGPGEEVLAAGIFEEQGDHGALMVSGVASPTAGSTGSVAASSRATIDRGSDVEVDRPYRLLVAVTPTWIHVIDRADEALVPQLLMGFRRTNTTIQVTQFGVVRHLNLVGADPAQRLGLIGSAAPSNPDASGDRLVLHLLSGPEGSPSQDRHPIDGQPSYG